MLFCIFSLLLFLLNVILFEGWAFQLNDFSTVDSFFRQEFILDFYSYMKLILQYCYYNFPGLPVT